MAVPIAALVALAQAGQQYAQANKQKKLARDLKPSNYVPNSVREATASSRMEANATMGPFSKRGLEKLNQSSATAIENAKRAGGSAGQIQQAVADTDAREKEAVKDLEVSDAAWRSSKRSEFNRNLQVQGQYENMSRDAYNAAKSALTGASAQNKYNAMSNLGEGVVNSYFDAQEEKLNTSSVTTMAGRGTPPSISKVTDLNGQGLYGDAMGRTRRMSGRRMSTSIQNTFDYQKYLADMKAKQFSTGY